MPRVQPPPSCKVYTPSRLARAMVEVVNEQDRVQRWLEPSCGRNAFIKAIRDLNIPRAKIVGVDLDVRQSKLDCLGMVSRGKDFFHGRKDAQKDLIVSLATLPMLRSIVLLRSCKNLPPKYQTSMGARLGWGQIHGTHF